MNCRHAVRRAGILGLFLTILVLPAPADHASDLNEVAAFLVYPLVLAAPGQETFVTVTNTAATALNAHLSIIEGTGTVTGVAECTDFNQRLLLTGNDTETLALRHDGVSITLASLDGPFSFGVPVEMGFMTINVEADQAIPMTLGDNVLMGSAIVADYDRGLAYSIDAIPFQADVVDDDRIYRFGQEFNGLPRKVAVSFMAPDGPASAQIGTPITAELAVFTLAFQHAMRPDTSCTLWGIDAHENVTSGMFGFGCWGVFDLASLDELAYPELGGGGFDDHGWLVLDCEVEATGDNPPLVMGGVDGALVQTASANARLDRPSGPALAGSAAWSRPFYRTANETNAVVLELAP